MSKLTASQLADYIDHTLFKPEATAQQIDQLCDQAQQLGFHNHRAAPDGRKRNDRERGLDLVSHSLRVVAILGAFRLRGLLHSWLG